MVQAKRPPDFFAVTQHPQLRRNAAGVRYPIVFGEGGRNGRRRDHSFWPQSVMKCLAYLIELIPVFPQDSIGKSQQFRATRHTNIKFWINDSL